MPTFTNSEVRTLFNGLSHITVDVEDRTQRRLPMLPGVRVKGMKDALESQFENIQEAIDQKSEIIEDLTSELKDRVDDEDDEFTADDLREAVNGKREELTEEAEELMGSEVEIQFDSPVTLDDIERIDRTDQDFPFVVSQAIDIIFSKVINNEEK